ncbi:MAG TPA: thermonuclease family protein [Micropepsaceae bacterium]|nr:thermonuclease family protein [Micropepsaceae bacterium]
MIWRIALALFLAAAAPIARAGEVLPGPYQARVERVIDGDSLLVRVRIWLGQEVSTIVRIRGVDAPELKGRCAQERTGAEAARRFIEEALTGGDVVLAAIENDKFGGRVIAQVFASGGTDVGAALVSAGLARSYDGGRRAGWC